MKAIIGLGNPGIKYENTWHNIGFLAVDEFIKKHNFPNYKKSKKFNALISEEIFDQEKIAVIKPQTYMNESGKAVRQIMDFYKLIGKEIIIVHDDIDLLQEKMKISADRGSAGHKGVDSIFGQTKIQDFIRLRIGINPDLKKTKKAMDLVLKSFSRRESQNVKKTLAKSVEALDCIIIEGVEKAMNKYNKA